MAPLEGVSQPPDGKFSLLSKGLIFTNTTIRGKACLLLRIPYSRVTDFVDGEGERNSSTFYIRTSDGKKGLATAGKENTDSNAAAPKVCMT